MLKETRLPDDFALPGLITFSRCHDTLNTVIAIETYNQMNMVRHHRQQLYVPTTSLLTNLHAPRQGFGHTTCAALITPTFVTIDGNEITRVVRNPSGDMMRQFLMGGH